MEDKRILVLKAQMPDEFMEVVNAHLEEGGWRVAQTEMSVTDHHYFALLIKSESIEDDTENERKRNECIGRNL